MELIAPGKGDFGWAALAGGRAVDPADFVDPRGYFGLQREAGYLWGTLRDDDGLAMTFMRRLPDPDATETAAGSAGSLGPRLILQNGWDEPGALHLRKEAGRAVRGELLARSFANGYAEWRSPEPGEMLLSLGAHDVRWNEHDLIDVSGPRVGPGLHWYVPGPDAAIYYPTQTWMVSGEALGRPVEGFLFYEEAYLPPGGRLYVHHDPLFGDQLHTTWYSWATEWDDGTLEFGHFLFGHDRFSVAVIGDREGNVTVPEHMECVVTRSEGDYWAERIDYVLDGEEWEMVAAPDGRMVDLGGVPNPQQEGIMRRVGDPRRPVRWMAWGETVPQHGEQRRRRRSLLPGLG